MAFLANGDPMKGLILLLLVLLGRVGFLLYKNLQDKRDLQKILRDTQADDEAHDHASIF